MEKKQRASKFKTKMLQNLHLVESSSESLIITNHGKTSIEAHRSLSTKCSSLEVLKDSVVNYIDPTEPVGKKDWQGLCP